jgi:hypothetical protein
MDISTLTERNEEWILPKKINAQTNLTKQIGAYRIGLRASLFPLPFGSGPLLCSESR